MEAAGGVVLCATGVGAPVGILLIAHGVDGAAAGFTQAITGEETEPFIHQGVRKLAYKMGATPTTANEVADGVDNGIAVAGAGASLGATVASESSTALKVVTVAKTETQAVVTEEAVVAESTREFTQIGAETGTNMIRSTQSKFGEVMVNSGHGFNRPHTTGSFTNTSLTMDQVENAIVGDLESFISSGGTVPQVGNNMLKRTINVGGTQVYYSVGAAGNQYRVATYAPILNP